MVVDKAIVVNKLVKNFEIIEKQPGLMGAFKSLVSPQKRVVHALKGISFSIQPGELVGFIGPNGAGKTTTLKTLCGLLYPTHGFIQVLEYNPWKRKSEYLKQIAVVFGQKNQLWWDLPAIETLELNKAIYELKDLEYEKNLEELTSLLEVKKLLNVQVRKLSLGQRMKLELVAALIHKPKVLFLDEPTLGLDLVAQAKMRDFVYEYNKKNQATIILTSHNMDDLLNLARRIIVIDEGKIIFDGILESLIKRFAKEKIIKVMLTSGDNIKQIERIGKIKKLSFPEVVLSVPRGATASAAAELLQNFPVSDLIVEEVPVEDVIRRVFKGGLSKK